MKPRIVGAICSGCKRPLIVTDAGKCLCCGRAIGS